MRITNIKATNFRALKEVELPMSSFACLIGENNAGKSSLLHAILRFSDGQRLSETDYYDKRASVRLEATLSVSDEDMDALPEEHRTKIKTLVRNGRLRLVRLFPPGADPELKCFRLVPTEVRWRESEIDARLKGKTPEDVKALALSDYPELTLPARATQSAFKTEAEKFRGAIPPADWIELEDDIPTGFPNSIRAILPDPIYIEAVKDIASVMRTADSAAFGKTLGLLLNVVEPKLSEEQALFDKLERQLNVVTDASGTRVDSRIAEVKELEGTIQGYLAENFPRATVGLEIPAPDVSTILQSARLSVHDGDVKGPVQTMGDGLKRSVMFALFRTYAELSRRQAWNPKVTSSAGVPRTIVLFEEPELYLHPKAQQVLFDALAQVSQTFQVAVTTHSPLFFSADKTGVFAKICKTAPSDGSVPFSTIRHVDMAADMTKKDVFQVLCYENCSVAFFATSVLLVEGSSDVVAMQHLAKTLNSDWDFENGRLRIVRVNGKGNLDRFKSFFAAFGITAYALADLDVIVDGFDKLGVDAQSPLRAERDVLLREVDKHALPEAVDGDGFKDKLSGYSWRQLAERFYNVAKSVRDGRPLGDDDIALVEAILADELEIPRRRVLRAEPAVRDAKLALLAKLRSQGVLVLEKGSLEDYYPHDIVGQDKFCKAEDMCKKVSTKEQALALASSIPVSDGSTRNELEAIFARVFWGSDTAIARPTEGR